MSFHEGPITTAGLQWEQMQILRKYTAESVPFPRAVRGMSDKVECNSEA
jgi:hypothetical protein